MHSIDLSKYFLRTDLIKEQIKADNTYQIKEEIIDNIKLETINIDKTKALELSLKEGVYKNIYFSDATDEVNANNLLKVLTKTLKDLFKELKLDTKDNVLIVGLGNRKATPDALGPLTIDNIKVTRHIKELNLSLDSKYRIISSLAPGVMGTTGIETKDIIEGVISKTKPDFLIVIDALASSNIENINKTIQITNTGINPGSGLLNNRFEISEKTINIPVIAIGIPTVVEASTIVANTIECLLSHFSFEKENYDNKKLKLVPKINRDYKNHYKTLNKEEKKEVLGMIGTLDNQQLKSLINEVLLPLGYNLLVTPKEIDFEIEKLSNILAKAINKSLEYN